METKYIAIIVIVVVAIAGIGAFFVLNGGGTAVDEIKETVEVGDYISADIDMGLQASLEIPDLSEGGMLLSQLYRDVEGDLTGQETIRYQGMSISCDIYTNTSEEENTMTYVDPTTGVVYKYVSVSEEDGMKTYILDNTSFDITKTEDEQVVEEGSFITMTTQATQAMLFFAVDLTGTTTLTEKITSGVYTVQTEVNLTGESLVKMEVADVKDDTIQIKGDDEYISKNAFLSLISTDYLDKYVKESGATIVYSEKMDKGDVKTPFGKRHVAEQEITISGGEGVYTMPMTVTVGDKNVIYDMDTSVEVLGQKITLSMAIEESSLIVH